MPIINPGKLEIPIPEPLTCHECGIDWTYQRHYKQARAPLMCPTCSVTKEKEREKIRAKEARARIKAQDEQNLEALRQLLNEGKPQRTGPSMDEVIRMAMERGISYGQMRSILCREEERKNAMRGVRSRDIGTTSEASKCENVQ